MNKHHLSSKPALAARGKIHVIDVAILRKQLALISDARMTLSFIEEELNMLRLEVKTFSATLSNAFGVSVASNATPEYIRGIAEDMQKHQHTSSNFYIQNVRM